MAESNRHLSFDKLEKILASGLTDRRLRQIADKGFFPKPENGLYDWVATVQGMLKYYREEQATQAERRKGIDEQRERKLKRENDLEESLVMFRADFVAEMRKVVEPIKQMLRQKLEIEYPTAVASMDVPQARIYGKRLEDDLLAEWKKLFLKFGI